MKTLRTITASALAMLITVAAPAADMGVDVPAGSADSPRNMQTEPGVRRDFDSANLRSEGDLADAEGLEDQTLGDDFGDGLTLGDDDFDDTGLDTGRDLQAPGDDLTLGDDDFDDDQFGDSEFGTDMELDAAGDELTLGDPGEGFQADQDLQTDEGFADDTDMGFGAGTYSAPESDLDASADADADFGADSDFGADAGAETNTGLGAETGTGTNGSASAGVSGSDAISYNADADSDFVSVQDSSPLEYPELSSRRFEDSDVTFTDIDSESDERFPIQERRELRTEDATDKQPSGEEVAGVYDDPYDYSRLDEWDEDIYPMRGPDRTRDYVQQEQRDAAQYDMQQDLGVMNPTRDSDYYDLSIKERRELRTADASDQMPSVEEVGGAFDSTTGDIASLDTRYDYEGPDLTVAERRELRTEEATSKLPQPEEISPQMAGISPSTPGVGQLPYDTSVAERRALRTEDATGKMPSFEELSDQDTYDARDDLAFRSEPIQEPTRWREDTYADEDVSAMRGTSGLDQPTAYDDSVRIDSEPIAQEDVPWADDQPMSDQQVAQADQQQNVQDSEGTAIFVVPLENVEVQAQPSQQDQDLAQADQQDQWQAADDQEFAQADRQQDQFQQDQAMDEEEDISAMAGPGQQDQQVQADQQDQWQAADDQEFTQADQQQDQPDQDRDFYQPWDEPEDEASVGQDQDLAQSDEMIDSEPVQGYGRSPQQDETTAQATPEQAEGESPDFAVVRETEVAVVPLDGSAQQDQQNVQSNRQNRQNQFDDEAGS